MISHHHRCVFVHINKCAGSSVEAMLGFDKEHLTLAEYRAIMAADGRLDDWSAYFKFTLVRNPWDRLVSLYEYRRSRGRTQGRPFREWVLGVFDEDLDRDVGGGRFLHWNQVDWLTVDGHLGVDYVGRVEQIDEDMDHVRRILSIDEEVPHHNRSRRQPYRTYYDGETIAVVADRYRRDIDTFGYRF